MNTIKKVLVAMSVVFAAHGVAQAAPLYPPVTTWEYTLTSEWINATFTNLPGGVAIPSGTNVPFNPSTNTSVSSKLISWGDPFPPNILQSSLGVTDSPAKSQVNTFFGGGTPPAIPPFLAIGTTLTHSNFPILEPFLTSTVLQSKLTLNNLFTPPTGPGSLPDLFFNIAFTETLNEAPCDATSPSGNPCNDIWVLKNQPFQNASFILDDRTYFVNLFPTTQNVLSVLEPAACIAAGQAAGCIGFTTPELAQTNLQFGFTISTEPIGDQVPEPGMLALIGLGLMGFAAAKRKKA